MATPIPINEARFTASEIAELTGGALVGASVDVRGVATDSRSVRPGNAFVALAGERFDAHAFVGDAISNGAEVVVVRGDTNVPENVCKIEVADTLVALGELAHVHRQRWKGTVVAVTGSAGKTTTKELIAAAFQGAGRHAFKTAGNLNNRVGVPMTLLQLDETVDTAVVELGTSEPGEIALLGRMVEPDVAVVTLVSVAHTEGLGSLEAVAEEKCSLFDHVPRHGHFVYNGDDTLLRRHASKHADIPQCAFGFSEGCDVRVLDWSFENGGTRCRLSLKGHEIEIDLALLGESAVVNAAAAVTVLACLGISVESVGRALSSIKPIPGRMYPLRSSNGLLILDDSYNANPRSTEAALHTASAMAKHQGRRLVVALGDMLELGSLSAEEHRAIGEQVVAAGAEWFVACGGAMENAAEVASNGGVESITVPTSEAASDALLTHVEDRDLVLIKGSRSMKMETVVQALATRGEAS